MPEILHPNPRNNNPDPSHDTRQHQQRGIIPHNRQRRIILQLRRRIRCLAHIPRPTPDAKTTSHADDEDEPGHEQYNIAPGHGEGVVPFIVRGVEEVIGLRNVRAGAGQWGALVDVVERRKVRVACWMGLFQRRFGVCLLARCY